MREIKFRAWNNKSKEMLDWFCICQSAFNSGETHLMYDVFTAPSFADDCGFIPMQYTGLKDKNGQESYESDACKVYIETGGISERKTGYMYGTIVFDKGEFLIIPYHYEGEITSVFGKDKIYGMLPYRISEKQFEIIGNIYTSPELLNPLHKQS